MWINLLTQYILFSLMLYNNSIIDRLVFFFHSLCLIPFRNCDQLLKLTMKLDDFQSNHFDIFNRILAKFSIIFHFNHSQVWKILKFALGGPAIEQLFLLFFYLSKPRKKTFTRCMKWDECIKYQYRFSQLT